MPKLKPDTIWPTEEEDARIKAGIDADPDTFESDLKRARPAREVFPDLVANPPIIPPELASPEEVERAIKALDNPPSPFVPEPPEGEGETSP